MDISEEIRRMVLESDLFEGLDPNIGLEDHLNFDSMSLIWLISMLEEKYGVKIDYRVVDLSCFQSVETIRQYIESRLGEAVR